MTTVLLIRHSKTNKKVLFSKFMPPLKLNKKYGLSKEGVQIAVNKLNNELLNDIDVIYSSDYKRAYNTAKILSKRLNKKIIIDSRFGERIHGIKKSYDELPPDFEMRQLNEEDYKFDLGESQKEVKNRMLSALNDVLQENKDKKIAIFSHSTAITFLLKKWSDITKDRVYYFNNKQYYEGIINYCGIFKLEFVDNNLVSIEYF